MSSFDEAIAAMPVIAILRGVEPAEAVDVGVALVEAGVRVLEVPLNSPAPLASISRLADILSGRAIVGAGTVISAADVDEAADAGAAIVVSPNVNTEVVQRTLARGIVSVPGVSTPTEMFTAIDAGATYLKLFPAEPNGLSLLSAVQAVLPDGISVFAVGGVTAANLHRWIESGAAGVGIGSDLYRRGDTVEAVAKKARDIAEAVRGSPVRRTALPKQQ